MSGRIVLRSGAERSLLRRHPWIFSGAIAEVEGGPVPGETVEVFGHDGAWLARGAFSPRSQIRVRVWTFDADEVVDGAFFERRVAAAIASRGAGARAPGTARRLIYSESDGLPGTIADRYDDVVACQFLSAGAERWRQELVAAIERELRPRSIFERSDVDVRSKEGLEPRVGLLAGSEPPELVAIEENGLRFQVDVRGGHKTGLYLDQRENRAHVASLARDRDVLDVFAYSGGFSIAALSGGARGVVQIESSEPALRLARAQLEANGFDPACLEQIAENAFGALRGLVASERRFDLVVLDPPKFVRHKGQLDAACRGYKDVNRLAFLLLRPGGVLVTFSCSSLLEPALFQKVVADAALDAGVAGQIVGRLDQADDHPVALSFPEAGYLKGLVCRVP